jgi:hypothetical protein
MYTANKRQRKYKIFFKFMLFVLPFIFAIGFLVWFIFMRPSESSANFAKAGTDIAQVQAAKKDFTNDYFKISLPVGWADHGKQNPLANQVFYEYQSAIKNYDNRWLHVYVDVFPADFAINKLLPVEVVNNRINPGDISDDCTTFTGSPSPGSGGRALNQTWSAKWQGVKFICSMTQPDNYVGTASVEEGYGITLLSKQGVKHKYFFVYIDHNVRPDYQIFMEALKSFETK